MSEQEKELNKKQEDVQEDELNENQEDVQENDFPDQSNEIESNLENDDSESQQDLVEEIMAQAQAQKELGDEDMESDLLPAVYNIVIGGATQAAGFSNLGDLENVILKCKNGSIVIKKCENDLILASYIGKNASPQLMGLSMNNAIKKLSKINEPIFKII